MDTQSEGSEPLEPTAAKVVTVAMPFILCRPCPEGIAEVPCLNCRSIMDIHQPDLGVPERMLGTCERCGSWHLLECHPDRGETVMVLLPKSESLILSARSS